MTRPVEPEDGNPGQSAGVVACEADGHAAATAMGSAPCPRCRALEDRIAALEAEVAELRAAARA